MKQQETLGFLGPVGTHSEEVALYFNNELNNNYKWKLRPYADINDVICAVAVGEIERCVVPVENSIEGSINITLDTLAHEVDLQIEHEFVWSVHNQLMVKDNSVPITTIISHAQPLAQCRKYIKANYEHAEIKQVASTAKAAEIVANSKGGCAAIGTFRAGELYKLKTIATEIQDNNTNCTRFLVLSRIKDSLVQGQDKTELICQIYGTKSGSLCSMLWEFAKRQVNLTRIESRPARTGLGEYIFFLSLDEASDKQNVKAAIEAVKKSSLWLKNLGSFNVTKVDIKEIRKGGRK